MQNLLDFFSVKNHDMDHKDFTSSLGEKKKLNQVKKFQF